MDPQMSNVSISHDFLDSEVRDPLVAPIGPREQQDRYLISNPMGLLELSFWQ